MPECLSPLSSPVPLVCILLDIFAGFMPLPACSFNIVIRLRRCGEEPFRATAPPLFIASPLQKQLPLSPPVWPAACNASLPDRRGRVKGAILARALSALPQRYCWVEKPAGSYWYSTTIASLYSHKAFEPHIRATILMPLHDFGLMISYTSLKAGIQPST